MKALLVLLFSLIAWPTSLLAEALPELTTAYSAEIHQTTGDFEVVGRIWVDGKRHRMQMTMDGDETIVLAHEDTGTIYMFSEGESTALAIDFSPEMIVTHETYLAMNPVFEGRENIRGEVALRFAIEGETPLGFARGTVWMTRDGILLRSETEGTMGEEIIRGVTELTNIQRGAVEASLFELPEGLTVMRH